MPNRINYQLEMERSCARWTAPARSCCCTPAVRPARAQHWSACPRISTSPILYYNPNIYPPEEYHRREAELERFCRAGGYHYPVVELPYDPQEFYTPP